MRPDWHGMALDWMGCGYGMEYRCYGQDSAYWRPFLGSVGGDSWRLRDSTFGFISVWTLLDVYLEDQSI